MGPGMIKLGWCQFRVKTRRYNFIVWAACMCGVIIIIWHVDLNLLLAGNVFPLLYYFKFEMG